MTNIKKIKGNDKMINVINISRISPKDAMESIAGALPLYVGKPVKIVYPGELDTHFDKLIIKFMKKSGYKWYAQGYDLTTNMRDIVFDKLIEE